MATHGCTLSLRLKGSAKTRAEGGESTVGVMDDEPGHQCAIGVGLGLGLTT